MMQLFICALISAALFYLASRALITRWLWSRYPPAIDAFFSCAACSGFWYGFFEALSLGQWKLFRSWFEASGSDLIDSVLGSTVFGLCMLVLTPIVAWVMDHAMVSLGVPSAASKEE